MFIKGKIHKNLGGGGGGGGELCTSLVRENNKGWRRF